jgi:Tol biopolymer transport system component
MSLAAGARLGPYEILDALGAGGMGEVYRARDPKLNRLIAVKVLREEFAADPERRLRFEREAQSIAALNHPNIVTIYSVEQADRVHFLTMELVDGKPLSDQIVKGGLPLARILSVAIPLADAISAAHQKGIAHRDLKPTNLMVTADGRVKVLDFGLAKLMEPSRVERAVSALPTVLTGEGRIVGTVAYMSPEQAQGNPIDHRSDLFSLGVILYELATGERPFKGDTPVSTIASVLRDTPRSITELNHEMPRDLAKIVRHCLVKDAEHRYQSANELRNDLEELRHDVDRLAPDATRWGPPVRRWSRALITLGVVTVGALALAAGLRLLNRVRTPPVPLVGGGRLRLLVSSESEARDPALSPDGKMIAYIAGEAGHLDLYVRRVAGGEPVRLTDDSSAKDGPSFSPDGDRIAFGRHRPDAQTPEICVIPALGGRAIPVISDGDSPEWSPDGTRLAFVLDRRGEPEAVATAAADGSDLRTLLRADADLPYFYWPSWAPDGTQLAISRSAGGIMQEVWLVPATGGPARRMWQDPPGVFSGQPAFSADGRGIVHASNRGGATNLWLMPINGKEPVRLTSGPGPDGSPSVARNGSIAFVNARSRATLIVHRFDTGEIRTLATHHSFLWAPSFSPDGREVAFSRNETDGSWHIWTVPADGGTPHQVTSSRLPEIYPRYTPDGSAILFQTWGSEPRRIWRVPRDGGQAVALTPARREHDEYADISPDGRWLAFARTDEGTVRVYVAPTAGGEGRRLTDSPSTTPRWSPDGQWIAFGSDRSVYGGIWLIRADGTSRHRLTQTGGWPVWWPDGKQIGYQTATSEGNEQIAVVRLDGGPPRILNTLRFLGINYPFDVSPDGNRLVTTNDQHLGDEIWLLEPHVQEK